jgi:uncharacterized RDD family membrane protein YckC/type II secretory pathway pseudopilin PulG
MENIAEWTEKPAGFWIRWMAQVVDGVIVGLPVLIVSVALSVAMGLALSLGPRGMRNAAYVVYPLLAVLAGAAYFAVLTSRGGQTLGKKLFKLKVLRRGGEDIGFGRALGRWAAYLLSYLPFLAGFVMAAFTPEKRALHDYVSDTKVIRMGPMSRAAVVAACFAGLFMFMVPVAGILAAIAIPSFGHMRAQANDVMVKGSLSNLRTAVAMYQMDNGRFPARLEDLVEGKTNYMDAIPEEGITKSKRSTGTFDGTGGWLYKAGTGQVSLNVDGKDTKGQAYRDYGLE